MSEALQSTICIPFHNTSRSHIKIVGLDNSLTGTGVSICHLGKRGDEPNFLTQNLSNKLRGVERLIYLREEVKEICWDADLVVIEGYAFAKTNQAHQIGELGGVLRVMLTESHVKWIEAAPTAVKKFATGKGDKTATKEAMAVAIYKRWKMEFPTNDQADAFVLSQIGRAIVEMEFDGEIPGWLTAFQKEVIEVIKNPVPKKKGKGKGGNSEKGSNKNDEGGR